MNEKDLMMFKRKAIRSKAELIRAFDDHLDIATRGDLGDLGEEKLELMREFKAKIEQSSLPFLEEPFSSYEITIYDIEISLDIAEYENIVFDQEGEIEESTASVTPDIVSVRAPYITIDEFAKKRNVKLRTVNRWLREGMLRNAENRDSCWYIAATQKLPAKRYISGVYIFEELDSDLSSIGPFPAGAIAVVLFRDCSCRSKHVVVYQDEDFHPIKQSFITEEERIEIEKFLIAAPNVIFQSNDTETITEKVGLAPDSLEDASNILLKIEEFIAQATLPSETKQLLKIMLLEGNEELFLSTIRKLRLDESLLHCVGIK